MRANVSTAGAQANGPVAGWGSGGVAVSADGRYIVFVSAASNLIAADTNGFMDVFVRDRVMGTTTLVSASQSGTQGNYHSFGPLAVSGDGRFIVFQTESDNLAPGTSLGFPYVVVLDRSTGRMRSPGQLGLEGIANAAISDDGRYLAYEAPQKDWTDVIRRDRATGRTVKINPLGLRYPKDALGGMSADGNRVFLSARNFNGRFGLFVRDFRKGWTRRVDRNSAGKPENRLGTAEAISADGHYVMFSSRATNLVPNDSNAVRDVFVRHLELGTTVRSSISNSDRQANARSFGFALSNHGRYQMFKSYATNLLTGDTNRSLDIFVRDRDSGTTRRCNTPTTGQQANGEAGRIGALSRDGQWTIFSSIATNLVPADTNGVADLFARGPRC